MIIGNRSILVDKKINQVKKELLVFTGEVETVLFKMKLQKYGSKEVKILDKKLGKIEGKIKNRARKGRIMLFLEGSCIRGLVPFLSTLRGDGLNTSERIKNGFFKFQHVDLWRIGSFPQLNVKLIKTDEVKTTIKINIGLTIYAISAFIISMICAVFVGQTLLHWSINTMRNNIISILAVNIFLLRPIFYFIYQLRGLLDIFYSYQKGYFDKYFTVEKMIGEKKYILFAK